MYSYEKKKPLKFKDIQIHWVIIGALGWVVLYVFQNELFYDPFGKNPVPMDSLGNVYLPQFDHSHYILSKILRYFLNDIFGILIVQGLFRNRSYNGLAFVVMLFGLLIIMPFYFYLLFNHIQSIFPFLNHIHRVLMNPVLMIMLILGLFYQHFSEN